MNADSSMPPDHPLRRPLAAEVHARPPAAVTPPAVVSCLALTDVPPRDVLQRVGELAERHGQPRPPDDAGHVVVELPGVRMKWEHHGEFTSLTFVRSLAGSGWERYGNDGGPVPTTDHPDAVASFPTALDALPPAWQGGLPGRVMAATDILLLPAGDGWDSTPPVPYLAGLGQWFAGDAMAGARVLDGAACVFTDFRLGPQGRTRWLVLSAGMRPAQSARVAQRIIDIEIYRMMALLAFPLARAAFPQIDAMEHELAGITAATAELQRPGAGSTRNGQERKLFDDLTRLAAEVEQSLAATAFRFSAAQAYWDLVRARIGEFREQRIGDMRTLGGFLARRLAPAMNSCAAAAKRQEALSARVERASALLRTRVDLAREEQNQQLLAAMERRGKIALRLQQTVEGLSIAALTYYGAGLVGHVAKPLRTVWPRLDPDWVVAASVPMLALLLYLAVRRLRRRLRAD